MSALTITFFILAASLLASAQTPVWFNTHWYDTQPQQSRVADMNGDGYLDIVSATGPSANVNVLLNDTTGLFVNPGNTYTVGGDAVTLAVADVNGDGKPDVVVGESSYNRVHILLNRGDGTLAEATTLLAGGTPVGIVIADLNGDGAADIAIAHSDNGYITFYTHQGGATTTTWSTPWDLQTGLNQFTGLAAGDISGDGRPDLAAVGCCTRSTSGGVNVLMKFINTTAKGSPSPSFAGSAVETGTADDVTLADLDKDGSADFIVPYSPKNNCVSPCNNSGVSWFFSNSDGTTTKGGYSYVSPNNFFHGAGGATVGDFNHDGLNDIAITVRGDNAQSGDEVRYLLATGPRSFSAVQPSAIHQVNTGITEIMSGDFNHDGQVDLVTVDQQGGFNDVKMAVAGDPGWGTGDSEYCAPPAAGTWHVCQPIPNQNFTTAPATVYFDGVATAPSGSSVSSTEVFIDGSVYDSSNNRGIIGMQNVPAGTHSMRFHALLSSGSSMDKSVTFTVGSMAKCVIPSTATVLICNPAPNSNVASTFEVDASSNAPAGQTISAMKLYVDGVAKFTSNGNSLSTTQSLANGTHKLTVKAWTNTGAVESSSETVTVGGGSGGGGGTGGCIPNSAGSAICNPSAGATVSSPVSISAGTRAPSGGYIYSMKVYVDGVAKTTVTNPTSHSTTMSINVSLAMASGSHTLTVVTYENNSQSVKATEKFTVR